jgi:hypothetical protein
MLTIPLHFRSLLLVWFGRSSGLCIAICEAVSHSHQPVYKFVIWKVLILGLVTVNSTEKPHKLVQ